MRRLERGSRLVLVALPLGLLACGAPAEPNWYLVYESRATGTVAQEIADDTETWEVGADGDGTPCRFTHEVIADSGPFGVACGEFFGFWESSGEVILDADQQVTSSPTLLGSMRVPTMTAELVITESVGEINYETHFVPANYLRRYTVHGELDCDADPELECEGVWSFDLVGEQTKEDVIFHTGDPI